MNRLLRLPAVKDITGLSRSTIYTDPNFPRPVKLGPRAIGWLEEEVAAWIAARVAEREAA
jgi:prophage regulatory protein